SYIGMFFFLAALFSCNNISHNIDRKGEDVLESHKISTISSNISFWDTVYVPMYSEIYSKTKDVKFRLTATLSIRNTSLADSMFVDKIDYYNTSGELVRKYLEKPIHLKPMETIDYVIEEDDVLGGTGANFIIIWGAKRKDIRPMFQGVMISTHGQQGISFLTNGISISRRNN
ncbi:MAG: DUF3124 domain-containing protein, partial [Bacteroidales bacterium]|nr:DUF3124 domain-containing protein [Bacteroidales bacterium]